MTEIDCIRCKGTGKVEKPVESEIKSGQCKACNVVVMGSMSIKKLEEHKGYCYECSGAYDKKRSDPDGICTDCGKTWRLH